TESHNLNWAILDIRNSSRRLAPDRICLPCVDDSSVILRGVKKIPETLSWCPNCRRIPGPTCRPGVAVLDLSYFA
ncbi:hypothetical protein MGG_16139, partial [Pyricularia oryzae 70-15]